MNFLNYLISSLTFEKFLKTTNNKLFQWKSLTTLAAAFFLTTVTFADPPVSSIAGTARTAAYTEYQIKAAFLFNFAQFVEWPASVFETTESPIVIGVLGECPFGLLLEQTVEGETINKRPIVIKRSRRVEDLKSCHVLFISRSEKSRLPQLLERLKGLPVLTVCELNQFAQQGGTIGFVLRDNKIHFELNLNTAERNGLKVSSKLSKLAVTICHNFVREQS